MLRRNATRNPEWRGDLGQLFKLEKQEIPRYLAVQIPNEILIESESLCTSRYKFKLRFWSNLNLQSTRIFPLFKISICISSFDEHFESDHLLGNGLYLNSVYYSMCLLHT